MSTWNDPPDRWPAAAPAPSRPTRRPAARPVQPRPAPRAPDRGRRTRPPWRGVLGVLAGIGFLVFKFGAKLKFLLLLLPKLKLFTTSLSMLVSVAAYALILGWQLRRRLRAAALRARDGPRAPGQREGIATSAPMFIPFLGALIMLKDRERDAGVEARIGLAGPIVGALGCLVPYVLYGGDRRPVLRRARLHRVLPQPLQPRARAAARRRARDGRPHAVDVGHRLRDPRRDDLRLPQPDHVPHPALRRHGDVAALEAPQVARGPGLPRRARAHAARRGRRLHRARRGPGRRDAGELRRARPRRRPPGHVEPVQAG